MSYLCLNDVRPARQHRLHQREDVNFSLKIVRFHEPSQAVCRYEHPCTPHPRTADNKNVGVIH
jgi:hypothetical protein